MKSAEQRYTGVFGAYDVRGVVGDFEAGRSDENTLKSRQVVRPAGKKKTSQNERH